MRIEKVAAVIVAVAIAGLFALRVATFRRDHPWSAMPTVSGFDCDEGWYTKSAQTLVRDGRFHTPRDFTAWTHNPGWALLLAGLFRVFGIGLGTARLASVAASAVSITALHAIARRDLSWLGALLVCLAALGTFLDLVYSRTGQPYAAGTALSLVALAIFVRRPGEPAACALSMAAAAAAALVKIYFGFTVLVAAGLWLADAQRVWGADRRAARRIAIALVAGCVVPMSIYLAIARGSPDEWSRYQGSVVFGKQTRGAGGLLAVLWNELHTFGFVLWRKTGCAVLLLATSLSGIALLVRRVAPAGPRAALALGAWLVVGVGVVGFSRHVPPRFLYFAVAPLAYLALSFGASLAGPTRAASIAAAIAALHLAMQAPAYATWLGQPRPRSQTRMARDVVRRIGGGPAPVLMGRSAAFVALHDARVRPIERGFNFRPGDLCARVRRLRPSHALYFTAESDLPSRCPRLVSRVVEIARYHVLDDRHGPTRLGRIEYRGRRILRP